MRAMIVCIGGLLATPAFAGGPTLDVTGDCPGMSTFSIRGITPGATVGLLAGVPGADIVPAGPCPGVVSDLGGLRLITSLRDSDRDGVITLEPSLPVSACGLSVQVLDTSSCAFTNVEPLRGGGAEVDLELTPGDGSVVAGDDPYWADKGYVFTAERGFEITGGSWLIDMPVDGFVRMSVYDYPSLELLARGEASPLGSGTEEWLRSGLFYSFEAGREYLVSFYTNRAGSSLFTRKDSPSYGYGVDGWVTNVTGWSSSASGDDALEGTGAGGYYGNSWAPYQRMHRVE